MAWSDAAREASAEARAANASHQEGILRATTPMQRRQYEAIAGAINRVPNNPDVPDMKSQLAQHFANVLQGTNQQFDAGKFKNAAMTGNMGRTKNADPQLQKRHFEVVAGAIHSLPASWRTSVANHFAGELGRTNPRFDSDRFVKASGGEPARDLSGRTAGDVKRDYKP